MLRSVVNNFLKSALDELFVDSGGRNSINLSLGADLFSDSSVNLSSLTFRNDIFDVCLQPLTLVSGHIGKLSLNGLAEALAGGGKITCTVNDMYLLFNVNSKASAEEVQLLKKVLIELQTHSMDQSLLRDLYRKLEKLPFGDDPDFQKKRQGLLDGINNFCNNVQFVLKNLHIRIELYDETKDVIVKCKDSTSRVPTPTIIDSMNAEKEKKSTNNIFKKKNKNLGHNEGNSPPIKFILEKCNSIGMIIPQIKYSQCKVLPRPDGLDKDDPYVQMLIKSLQVYCDYNVDSYLKNGNESTIVFNEFVEKWRTEIHTAIIAPFDIDMIFAAEIKKKTGLLSPKIILKIPKLKLVVDSSQVDVFNDLINTATKASRRSYQLCQLLSIYNKNNEPPMVTETGGMHILPYLTINSLKYPTTTTIPKFEEYSMVSTLKGRVGIEKWAREAWKYIIRMVIADIRIFKPFGRWLEIGRLTNVRKKYVFMYAKFLKESTQTGNFIFNVNARVSPQIVKKLHEYEMLLPISAIKIFRSLAHQICYVNAFNLKRKEYRNKIKSQNPNQDAATLKANMSPWEKVHITYNDILLIQTMLDEVQQQKAFEKYNRRNNADNDEDSVTTEKKKDNGEILTPTAKRVGDAKAMIGTNKLKKNDASDFVSISGNKKKAPSPKTVSKSPTMISNALSMFSSSTANTSHNSSPPTLPVHIKLKPAKSVTSTAMSFMKSATGFDTDDLDHKTLGTVKALEFHMLGDMFGKFEKEDYYREDKGQELDNKLELKIKDSLGGIRPSIKSINEAVEWAISRHQRPLTFSLPDIKLSIDVIDFMYKFPFTSLEVNTRKNIMSFKIKKIALSVIISRSPNITKTTTTLTAVSKSRLSALSRLNTSSVGGTYTQVESKNGFVSLIGCLVQVKCSTDSFTLSLYVHNAALAKSISGTGNKIAKVETINEEIINTVVDDDDLSDTPPQEFESDDDSGTHMSEYLQATKKPAKASISSISSNGTSNYKQITSSNLKSITTTVTSHYNAIDNELLVPFSVDVISCGRIDNKKDDCITFCLMLDYDLKGEGGADLQLHFGSTLINLNGDALASLSDVAIVESVVKCIISLDHIMNMLPLLSQKSFIVDYLTNTPVIKNKYLNENKNREAKEDIVSYMNYKYWCSALIKSMPNTISVSIQTSDVQLQFLSMSAISEYISNRIVAMAEKTGFKGLRDRRNSLDEINSKMHNIKNISLAKMFFKNAISIRNFDRQYSSDRNPLKQDSSRMDMSIPIEDEVLVDLLALLLANYAPVYIV